MIEYPKISHTGMIPQKQLYTGDKKESNPAWSQKNNSCNRKKIAYWTIFFNKKFIITSEKIITPFQRGL